MEKRSDQSPAHSMFDHADPGTSRLHDGEAFQERLANRTLHLLPALTRSGAVKVRTPELLQTSLKAWFEHHRHLAKPEPNVARAIRSDESEVAAKVVRVDEKLNQLALSQIQPLLERWCGYQLEPVWAFGLRVYGNGSVLYRHVDIVNTHVISASLLVAQDVDEPWPIVMENFDGTRREFVLRPGEAVLYEGTKLPHFRDVPLQGRFYVTLFVHFKPRWWNYEQDGVEALIPKLPPHYPKRSLAYGKDNGFSPGVATLAAKDEEQQTRKYLAFETDAGGWNNILMQFEIMVMLALITGRILVLPPARPFYLLGDAPRLLQDFLDLNSLRRHLNVLTADEFAAECGSDADIKTDDRYHEFMRVRGQSPQWHGLDDVLVYPEDGLRGRPELNERVVGRRIVDYGKDLQSAELLYFPMTEAHRMFGVAETFCLFGDRTLERKARRVLRDAVRYRPEILALAERALEAPTLAGGTFSAMHVRRGDFQYAETQISAEDILRHTKALFRPGQTIYLATDEPNGAFFHALRGCFHVVTFDLLPEDVTSNTPEHWLGIIETLICAGAPGRFVGTRLSTFSARIALLRGHLSCTQGADCEGVDTALYYTQPPLPTSARPEVRAYLTPSVKHMDEFGETAMPWWQSVQTVPFWGRTYSNIWTETND